MEMYKLSAALGLLVNDAEFEFGRMILFLGQEISPSFFLFKGFFKFANSAFTHRHGHSSPK